MRSNNYKRNRNRNQNRRNGNGSSSKSTNIDSSGPDVRVRGSAIQVNEKYMALANDASMSGDRIKADHSFSMLIIIIEFTCLQMAVLILEKRQLKKIIQFL